MERGHALAYAWNCSISSAEAVLVELRCQNQQLMNINSQLAAGQEELVNELKAVDFLRWVVEQVTKYMKLGCKEVNLVLVFRAPPATWAIGLNRSTWSCSPGVSFPSPFCCIACSLAGSAGLCCNLQPHCMAPAGVRH